jgi:hypothetical protein
MDHQSNDIHDIIQWPKNNGFYAKVPTLLYYRNKNGKLLDWGKGARLLSLRVSFFFLPLGKSFEFA